MKKILWVVLMVVVLSMSVLLTACDSDKVFVQSSYDATEQLQYTLIDNSSAYEVSGIDITTAGYYTINIPASSQGLPVTSIADNAFDNNVCLMGVTIADSVVSIGNYAFSNCESLVELDMGNGIVTVGNYSFQNCYSIDCVNLPDSVVSVGECAFYYCYGVTNLTLGSVSDIGANAFFCLYNIRTVTIPATVTNIGDKAFLSCHTLVEVYNLSSINMTVGSTEGSCIGSYALDIYTDSSAQSKLSTDKDGYITYDNTLLVGYVGESSAVVIPSNVTDINKRAFCSNSDIYSVTIGSQVQTIADEAFFLCVHLVEVYNLANEASISNISFLNQYAIHYYTDNNTESQLSIDDDGFVTCQYDQEVVLVDYIGTVADVHMPSNVTRIGSYAFYNNHLITYLTIDGSVTHIGSDAVYGCGSLSAITIGKSVQQLGAIAV